MRMKFGHIYTAKLNALLFRISDLFMREFIF